MAGYVAELAETPEMLNSRCDSLKGGEVKPIDGEAFFESLRRREDRRLRVRRRSASRRAGGRGDGDCAEGDEGAHDM